MILNYLGNRRDFYEALLKRLPDQVIRRRAEVAFRPVTPEAGPEPAISRVAQESDDPYLLALGTLDLLKKPAHGAELGRTTISVDEALARALTVEELGILIFGHLAELHPRDQQVFTKEKDRRKTSLIELLRLRDQLRYHRLGSASDV